MKNRHARYLEPEISCRILAPIIRYFETKYVTARFQEFYAALGADAPTWDYVQEIRNFVSLEFVEDVFDQLTEFTRADPDFFKEAALNLITPGEMGFLYYAARAFGSPQALYRRIPSWAAACNSLAVVQIMHLDRTSVILSVRSLKRERNRNLCIARRWQYASFPRIWGLPSWVQEHHCQLDGAESCVYEIRWRGGLRPILPTSLFILSSAALGAYLFRHGLSPRPGIWAGAMAGGATAFAIQAMRRVGWSNTRLRDVSDSHGQSLTELRTRFVQIQELTAKLECQLKIKDEFLSIASHELRTPLTSLRLGIDLLNRLDVGAESPRKVIHHLSRSVGRLERLAGELVIVSNLQEGALKLRMENVDLRTACVEAVEDIQDLTSRAVVFEDASSAIWIQGDHDRIVQVINGLLMNAIKYSLPESTVRIRLEKESGSASGSEAVIRVIDEGIGIPESELPNLFNRYHRIPGNEVQYGSHIGLGLGLYVCRGIIERHRGKIEVKSRVGIGSEFSVRIPIFIVD